MSDTVHYSPHTDDRAIRSIRCSWRFKRRDIVTSPNWKAVTCKRCLSSRAAGVAMDERRRDARLSQVTKKGGLMAYAPMVFKKWWDGSGQVLGEEIFRNCWDAAIESAAQVCESYAESADHPATAANCADRIRDSQMISR
jgi:hypothetical protein